MAPSSAAEYWTAEYLNLPKLCFIDPTPNTFSLDTLLNIIINSYKQFGLGHPLII